MNHKSQSKFRNLLSFVDVSINVEIRSAPCLAYPPSGHHSWGGFLSRPWIIRPEENESSFSRNYFIFQRGEVQDLYVLVDSNYLQNSSLPLTLFLVSLSFSFVPYYTHLFFIFIAVSLAISLGNHLAISSNIPHTTILLLIIALLP